LANLGKHVDEALGEGFAATAASPRMKSFRRTLEPPLLGKAIAFGDAWEPMIYGALAV
jgi:hypothetical protein